MRREACFDLLNSRRRRLINIIRIVHDKSVEDQSACQRVDVGREDLQPLAGEGAGELVKHAGRNVFVSADGELDGMRLRQIAAPGLYLAVADGAKLAQVVGDPLRRRAVQHAAGERFYLRLEPGEIGLAVEDSAAAARRRSATVDGESPLKCCIVRS